jgi:hypothetical protein
MSLAPQAFLQIAADDLLAGAAQLLGGDAPVAQRRAGGPVRDGDGTDALHRAGGADHAVEALLDDLAEEPADFGVDEAVELALVARRHRIALHEALGQPDHAQLEALSAFHGRAGAARDLDAATADVDDDADVAGEADAVRRGPVNQAGLFGAGNDMRADAGGFGDLLEELAAVLRLARRAGRDSDDLVHAVAVGEAAELRHHLKRGVHGLGRERAAVETARAEADHLLFAVDDFK